MESGIIALEELYAFARRDPSGEALNRNSSIGRKYGKLVDRVKESIPKKKGVYLWGKYEINGLWKNIYIGQSGDGPTARLQWRIGDEELKKEGGAIFWLPIIGKENLIMICRENYPNAGNYWERGLAKAETTRVIWVVTPPDLNNDDIKEVESDLIETMNPRVNKDRPVPPNTRQQITLKIIGEFRRRIHENR